RLHADHDVGADDLPLVHDRAKPEVGPPADMRVTCHLDGVGQSGMVGDVGVMRNVGVRHEVVVIAECRDPIGTLMNGHELSHDVVVSDPYPVAGAGGDVATGC